MLLVREWREPHAFPELPLAVSVIPHLRSGTIDAVGKSGKNRTTGVVRGVIQKYFLSELVFYSIFYPFNLLR